MANGNVLRLETQDFASLLVPRGLVEETLSFSGSVARAKGGSEWPSARPALVCSFSPGHTDLRPVRPGVTSSQGLLALCRSKTCLFGRRLQYGPRECGDLPVQVKQKGKELIKGVS